MKARRTKLSFIFLLTSSLVYSQEVTVNYVVDTSDTEIKEVIELWTHYINSKPDSIYDNPYWNAYEKEQYEHFDFLRAEFSPSLYMGFPVHILSIKSYDGIYQIKSQFSYCKEDGTPYVLCIANFNAKKENGEFKLYNALPFNRKSWNHTKLGYVDYYYPPYHEFDSSKANALNTFVMETCNNLAIEPKQFEYYLADDFDEIQQVKGIDYWMGMGGEIKPTGRSAFDKVYCSGMGENYPHEPFHILTRSNFLNMHGWVHEGMATWLGGSRGQPLSWHISRTNEYLKAHPEISLNEMLKLRTIDEYTDYRYVLGGLICQLVYEKGGWELIKEFMNSGKSNDEYYSAIEKYLGVKKNQINDYVRQELGKRAKE